MYRIIRKNDTYYAQRRSCGFWWNIAKDVMHDDMFLLKIGEKKEFKSYSEAAEALRLYVAAKEEQVSSNRTQVVTIFNDNDSVISPLR